MPTRKQKRRRDKQRRHEWEEVYVDEEGRELAPEEVEELGVAAKPDPPAARSRKPAGRSRSDQARRMRPVQPPSWRRVVKRALIFAPMMYIVISLLESETTLAERLITTGYLILIFMPFSYVMDSMTYRIWKRRTERTAAGQKS